MVPKAGKTTTVFVPGIELEKYSTGHEMLNQQC